MAVQLGGTELVLSLSRGQPDGGHTLSVHPSMDAALAAWDASTRCSPVYPLNKSQWPTGKAYSVWFVGPLYPGEAPAGVPAFLALGIYNLVLIATSQPEREAIEGTLARLANVPWERWNVSTAGVVNNITYAPRLDFGRKGLADRGQIALQAGLRSMAEEYRTLVAATVAKAESYLPEVAAEVRKFDESFRRTLESPKFKDVTKSQWLVNVNASLSRFSSQTFAGISPITGTECHYWTHSLLGVGLGVEALLAIRRQVQLAFDKADFRRRLQALAKVPANPTRLEYLSPSDGFWQQHHLPREVGSEPRDQLTPIVCFSGRDGFKSTTHTLSVPLEVISAANTVGWTLRTVTHELSHVFVDAILGALLPSIDQPEGAHRLVQLMEEVAPKNLYEQLQAYFCFTLCTLVADSDEIEVRSDRLVEVVRSTYPEVSEILTHVFDFLYFYQRDPGVYIPAIWASWDVIPNIMGRIDDYLVRTLCAVMVNNLTADDPYQASHDLVLEQLEQLSAKLPDANIIDQAVATLRSGAQRFRAELAKKVNLVQLSNAFLNSPDIVAIISRGVAQSRGAGRPFVLNVFDVDESVDNPLSFIYYLSERVALTNQPDFQRSAWMIAQLAFAGTGDDND